MGLLARVLSCCAVVVCLTSLTCGDCTTVDGSVLIDGENYIAETDENFVCANLDLWPGDDKCDYGTCSWGMASLLNVDLNNVILFNAIKAFSPLRMRLGGTLQDRLIYQTRNIPCVPFIGNTSQLFNFTEGCMPLSRWDELNTFISRAGAIPIFGLNALNGKIIWRGKNAMGPWDSTNAESLIRYTAEKGYSVHGWELGNELGGWPILGVAIDVNPYASDTDTLRDLIKEIYRGSRDKPLVIAPGAIFEPNWFDSYIPKTNGTLDVITHHTYPLGPGSESDTKLMDKILNATALDKGAEVFRRLYEILKKSETSTVAWIGESGGVYNSGRDGITNTFLFSFWYLDHMGLASVYDTKVYCRQTLIGGNYGLLNTTSFVPNPDYYSALLWHRLMGKRVLSTRFRGTKSIRAYAHCAKPSKGITILLINLDGKTKVRAKLDFNSKHGSKGPNNGKLYREEYHLSPFDGNLQSQTVLLNGEALTVGPSGAIPTLKPVRVASSGPVTIYPHTIVFVHVPNSKVPACK
ncbi:Heparanase-like protein 3 [Striga hermonthica]|uniref:Heparanase-like protein 3 n=1 Tax=Striga hermonthica TaxID=68872 RepID=A0A9N7N307_STRHE|nr:Heparanase-like protein 3 [Striga hermonthica]